MFENLPERHMIPVKREEEGPSEPDAPQPTGIRAVLTDPFMNCGPVRCIFDGDALISGTNEVRHPDFFGPREQRAELSLLSQLPEISAVPEVAPQPCGDVMTPVTPFRM